MNNHRLIIQILLLKTKTIGHTLKMKCNKQKNQWVHNFHITSIYLSMTRARFRLLFNPYKECKYMCTYRLWSLKYTNTSYTQWGDRQFLFLTFTVMHSITIYSQYCISVGSYIHSHLFNSRCKINIFIYFWVKRLRRILVLLLNGKSVQENLACL